MCAVFVIKQVDLQVILCAVAFVSIRLNYVLCLLLISAPHVDVDVEEEATKNVAHGRSKTRKRHHDA